MGDAADADLAIGPADDPQRLARVYQLPKQLRLSVAPIVPGLFLGEERAFGVAAVRRALVQHHGLGVVVRCIPRRHGPSLHQKAWQTCDDEGLRLVTVEVEDDEESDIRHGFQTAFTAIDSVIDARAVGVSAKPTTPIVVCPPATPPGVADGAGGVAAAAAAAPGPWDRADAGPSVLVHCQAGVSRSASVVIGWLMHRRGMCLDAADALVRSARHRACPNDGFIAQLVEDDTALRRSGKVDLSLSPSVVLSGSRVGSGATPPLASAPMPATTGSAKEDEEEGSPASDSAAALSSQSGASPASVPPPPQQGDYDSTADAVTGLLHSPFDADLFCKYQIRFPFVSNAEMRRIWRDLHAGGGAKTPGSPAAALPLWSSGSSKHAEMAKLVEALNNPRGRAFNAQQAELESAGEVARVMLLSS